MAFVLMVLYVAILMVRPQEWYEPVKGYELVNVIAVLTILAALTTRSTEGSVVPILSRNKFARLMWGILAAVVLSQLTKFHIQGTINAVSDFGKIAIFFFLLMIVVDRPGYIHKMMWVIVLCAGFLCIHAYLQVRQGYGFGNITPYGSWEDGDFRVRGSGQFNDPNDFSTLFIMAVPFVFSLLRVRSSLPMKAFLVGLLPAMLGTLYYTQSRGGMMGFCAMLLAYLWIGSKKSLTQLVMTSAILAVVVAFGPERARGSYYEGAAAGRVVAWGIGNSYLKQNPLFGIGFDQWDFYERTAAHSSYVKCYAELGLVGYALWFSLCWLVVRKLARVLQMRGLFDPATLNITRGILAALIGYLVAVFFLSRTYHHMLYFLLGLGIGLIRHVERQPTVPRGALDLTQRDYFQAVIASVLSIPVIYVVVKAYWAMGGMGT